MLPFVRPATIVDVPRADSILYGCLREYGITPDPNEAALALEPMAVDLVAQIGEALVGFASMVPRGEREGWIDKLFVDPRWRRRGVATVLLDRLEREARARAWRRLGLSTRAVFKEAIALYEARGWVRAPAPFQLRRGRDRTYVLDLD